MADIRIDDRQIRRLEKDISEDLRNAVKKSTFRALSRTRTGAKTFVSKFLRKTYSLPAKRIKKGARLTTINRADLSFRVIGESKPISLTSYSGTRELKRGGVSVAVKKGEREKLTSAFIRPGIGGSPQAFTRFNKQGGLLPRKKPTKGYWAGKGVKRTQIRALKGPSVAGMFRAQEIEKPLGEEAINRFFAEFDRSLAFWSR